MVRPEMMMILVEDDPEIRGPLVKLLECYASRDAIRLKINAFPDGESALQALNTEPRCDLIVSDWNLGPNRMDGLEFLTEIRETRQLAVPAILNTGSELDAHARQLLGRLRVTHVRKPNLNQLWKEVVSTIN